MILIFCFTNLFEVLKKYFLVQLELSQVYNDGRYLKSPKMEPDYTIGYIVKWALQNKTMFLKQ